MFIIPGSGGFKCIICRRFHNSISYCNDLTDIYTAHKALKANFSDSNTMAGYKVTPPKLENCKSLLQRWWRRRNGRGQLIRKPPAAAIRRRHLLAAAGRWFHLQKAAGLRTPHFMAPRLRKSRRAKWIPRPLVAKWQTTETLVAKQNNNNNNNVGNERSNEPRIDPRDRRSSCSWPSKWRSVTASHRSMMIPLYLLHAFVFAGLTRDNMSLMLCWCRFRSLLV